MVNRVELSNTKIIAKPLHLNISMHILHTILYTFSKVLTRRICFLRRSRKMNTVVHEKKKRKLVIVDSLLQSFIR